MLLAGCEAGVSPVQPVLSAVTVEIGGQDHQVFRIETAPESPILVTVTGSNIDLRAALVTADGKTGPFADAPNRRMGIETLLVEAPHDKTLTIRIERNDHAQAHGTVTVDAVALPVVTEADRRRLDAARLETQASLQFSDLAKGTEAADAYAAAADLHDRNDDDRSAGIALLHAAGARYLRLSDWRGAADLAQHAGSALDDTDARKLAAFALRVEGAALDQLADAIDESGDRDEIVASAREKLGDAAERFAQLGMPYEAGYALNYRGVSYQNGGKRDLARADFEQALGLFRKARDKPAQALSLQSLATLSHEDGRLADAMREFDAALALIPRDEDPANYAHTLHNSARPLQVLGRFDEALARYYAAAAYLHQLGDRDGEARALHGMGTTYRYAGESDRAIDFLRLAIKLRGSTGSRREQATSLIVLGQIEREFRHIDSALGLHEEAAALVTAPNDRARAILAMAQDHLADGNLKAARQELDGLFQLDLPPTHRHRGLAYTELGEIEALAGNVNASDLAFARAIAIHKANGSDLEQARALYRRSVAKLRIGDTRAVLADTLAALKLFDRISLQGTHAESRASFRATYRGTVELRIAAYVADAADAAKREDTDQEQRLLRAALETSDETRAQLIMDAGAFGPGANAIPAELLTQRQETFDLLAGKRQQQDRLLEAAEPDASRLTEISRDISLLRAQATLIESRIAEAHLAPVVLKSSTANQSGPAVLGDFVVAEYFLGDKHSWLFEVRDGVVAVHTLASHAQLEVAGRTLYQSWRTLARHPIEPLADRKQLAKMIFEPLEGPGPDRSLVIVPDGVLHLVPMALLAQLTWPNMRPGAAIIIPSIAAVREDHLLQVEAAAKTLAVIADPIYVVNDSRIGPARVVPSPSSRDAMLTRGTRSWTSLQRLPATALEARDLIALVGNPAQTLALIGPDATRESVTTAPLDQYRIVHFATHAQADSQDPALATLGLSRWDIHGKPLNGELRSYDITQLHLNADLVVLSGCDTMLGREIAGEGPIGLSQAFLRIGARSVLATLWPVSDTSTAVLMHRFYREYLTNKRDASVALQMAQDSVRKEPRWSDPYYWAGFQLVSMTRIDRKENAE